MNINIFIKYDMIKKILNIYILYIIHEYSGTERSSNIFHDVRVCSRFVYFLTFFLFCRHVGYIYPWQAGTTRGGARARTEDDDTYTGIDRR